MRKIGNGILRVEWYVLDARGRCRWKHSARTRVNLWMLLNPGNARKTKMTTQEVSVWTSSWSRGHDIPAHRPLHQGKQRRHLRTHESQFETFVRAGTIPERLSLEKLPCRKTMIGKNVHRRPPWPLAEERYRRTRRCTSYSVAGERRRDRYLGSLSLL